MDAVTAFEQEQIKNLTEKKDGDIPKMRVGDTIKVYYRIKEGDKHRNQPFQGTLIRIKGSGLTKTITLRKIVAGEGVERIFPLYSPNLVKLEVTRFGKARRAKLYYLRDRVGKATKIKERQVTITKVKKKKKKKKKKSAEEKAKAAAERKAAIKAKKAKGKKKKKKKSTKKDKE